MADAAPAGFVIRMLIALLGGMLIGLERERAQISSGSKARGGIPGMRSFGLLSLYGALVAYSAASLSGQAQDREWGLLLLASGFASMLLLVTMYAYARMIRLGVQGVTTYIVMFVTFASGALAGAGMILESASVSVLVTLTLALKHPAERAAASIVYSELIAIIEVLALALVLGPIVKALSAEPGLAIAYKTYIFFLVILSISLLSYLTAKAWGARGIIYAAILGAMVNSEATIASIARQVSRLPEQARRRLVGAVAPIVIIVAQAKLVALALLGFAIFTGSIPRLPTMTLAAVLLYLAVLGKLVEPRLRGAGEASSQAVEIQSPLNWGGAAKSALAYAGLTLLFLWLEKTPLAGMSLAPVTLSFIGGLVSATAVILSLGTTIGALSECVATASILAVLASVSLNKMLYVRTVDADRVTTRVIGKWSLALAAPPLVLLALFLAWC